MRAHTPRCFGAKQVWTGGPSARLWEKHEAAEDTVCLGAAVDHLALGRVGAHGDPVAHGQAEHAAARVDLQDVAAVVIAEADHALPVLGDAQAEVPAGDHLEGEVVEPGDAAGELPGLGTVGALLVGDDVVEHHCPAHEWWGPPRGREGRTWLLQDVADTALVPLRPRLPWGPRGAVRAMVALVPWDARRSWLTCIPFGSLDARPLC